ncbi:hypothetical protein DFH08DRAFT_802158 [Mycena albidolilacea]|uniref:Uncharacterized protein n=1 Tax=Mycena albidolilacea TaxID=1033008 RepID=A0AAD7AGT6_9AGAR|nr:hypothetical protein DFH08DRAFT_802158 [Mycena albidolilacea]
MFRRKACREHCLSLIFLRALTNGSSLRCPSFDDDGNALFDSQVYPEPVPYALLCAYDNGPICFYKENGSPDISNTGCPSREAILGWFLGSGGTIGGITTVPTRPSSSAGISLSSTSPSSTKAALPGHTDSPPPIGNNDSSSHSSSHISTSTDGLGISENNTGSPKPTRTTDSSSPSLPMDSAGTATGIASPSPTASIFPNASQKSDRITPRTAVIAASVASVGILVAVVALFLWVRRRRQRIDQRRLPEQFTEAQQEVLLDTLPIKADGAPHAHEPDDDNPILPQTDPAVAEPESGVLPADPEDGTREETLTARMHRMEARLEALATMVLPEDSPPSYTR